MVIVVVAIATTVAGRQSCHLGKAMCRYSVCGYSVCRYSVCRCAVCAGTACAGTASAGTACAGAACAGGVVEYSRWLGCRVGSVTN